MREYYNHFNFGSHSLSYMNSMSYLTPEIDFVIYHNIVLFQKETENCCVYFIILVKKESNV